MRWSRRAAGGAAPLVALAAATAALLLAVVGCSGGDRPTEGGALVEVDLYSGRTNPGAMLEARSANELHQ